MVTLVEWYGVDEVVTLRESVPELLEEYSDVFDWPEQLPPKRGIEHHIHLKFGTRPINIHPCRYMLTIRRVKWRS